MRPPARLPTSLVRPPCQSDKEITSLFEYIQAYSSIFEYVRGIFKEYSENMSNMPGSRPV
jgi:hypothetical protein